jgi:hypothetical protein
LASFKDFKTSFAAGVCEDCAKTSSENFWNLARSDSGIFSSKSWKFDTPQTIQPLFMGYRLHERFKMIGSGFDKSLKDLRAMSLVPLLEAFQALLSFNHLRWIYPARFPGD